MFFFSNLLWRFVDALLDSAWFLDPVLRHKKVALVVQVCLFVDLAIPASSFQHADCNVKAIAKNDLADFMVCASHPTPHCVFNVKLKRGGPEHWKRGPSRIQTGPERTRTGVVESVWMFETMMQEVLQD